MRDGLSWAIGGQITGEVTGEVQRLLKVLVGEMKRMDIQEALALRHEDYFREAYLVPELTACVVEMIISGNPQAANRNTGSPQKAATSSRNWRRKQGAMKSKTKQPMDDRHRDSP